MYFSRTSRTTQSASARTSSGKLKDLGVTNSTVQKHVTRIELRLLFDRNQLVAAVLDEQVVIRPEDVVPIDGDGRLHAAVGEAALVKSDAVHSPPAGVLPEGKDDLRLVPRVCTEIEMPPQAGLADLRQDPAILEPAVPRRWGLGAVRERALRGEPRDQTVACGDRRG